MDQKTIPILLTLPTSWIEVIDKETTPLKTRQDVIRDWIQPVIEKKQ